MKYEKPEIEIIRIEGDVITISVTEGDGGEYNPLTDF